MKNNLAIIFPAGWRYITYTIFSFIIFWILDLDFLSSVSFIMMIILLFLYRNPEKQINNEQEAILSPIDGSIVSIEELKDNKYRYKIDIDTSSLNISVMHSVMNSSVKSIRIVKGSRLSKKSKLFELLNEHAIIELCDEKDNEIKIIHRLRQSISPLDIKLIPQQKLQKGDRYGIAIYASTSIYLPSSAHLNVNILQNVSAAETSLAFFS